MRMKSAGRSLSSLGNNYIKSLNSEALEQKEMKAQVSPSGNLCLLQQHPPPKIYAEHTWQYSLHVSVSIVHLLLPKSSMVHLSLSDTQKDNFDSDTNMLQILPKYILILTKARKQPSAIGTVTRCQSIVSFPYKSRLFLASEKGCFRAHPSVPEDSRLLLHFAALHHVHKSTLSRIIIDADISNQLLLPLSSHHQCDQYKVVKCL